MAVSAQAEIPSQLGRSAVVMGATGGLGYEMALALAKATLRPNFVVFGCNHFGFHGLSDRGGTAQSAVAA